MHGWRRGRPPNIPPATHYRRQLRLHNNTQTEAISWPRGRRANYRNYCHVFDIARPHYCCHRSPIANTTVLHQRRLLMPSTKTKPPRGIRCKCIVIVRPHGSISPYTAKASPMEKRPSAKARQYSSIVPVQQVLQYTITPWLAAACGHQRGTRLAVLK